MGAGMIQDALDIVKSEPEVIWQFVKQNMRVRFGEPVYRNWISKITFGDADDKRITLHAATKFIGDWVRSYYHDSIIQLWQYHDPEILYIDIIALQNEEEKETSKNNLTGHNYLSANISDKPRDDTSLLEQVASSLDTRFTFQNFVVGNSNQLAYAAACAIAESGKVQPESNPLFLYGGVGLGKTHLMHAIANYIRENNPERKVIYLSAEKFMYQFVRALRNKDVITFKEQFRSVDVLMIDDVQFICGKDSTQEEFFHTFNALIDSNRQIVLSCDRSPSDLDNIEERIRSRLGWGLVVDVHSTNYELRLGILQSKCELLEIEIPGEVLEFLANKIVSNVRELEGALNKVIAYSNLMNKPITLESTQMILKDLLRASDKAITVEEIQKKVAEHFNIKVADMSSTRRARNIARPRQVAMYLSKMLTTKSLMELGKKFGGKDHSTILHAIKTIEKLLLEDKELAEDIHILEKIIKS